MALPAFARYKPQLQQLISISCLPGTQQQTCSSRFATVAALGPCWDRQTDGHRTVSQTLLYTPCRAMPTSDATSKCSRKMITSNAYKLFGLVLNISYNVKIDKCFADLTRYIVRLSQN